MKCKVCPLIVSLIVLWASSCNSKVFYDYERYGLNCPVKSVKVTTYKAESKFGDIVKDVLAWDGHYLAKFNTIGNLEEISWFDHEGTLYSVDQYKYNDNNKIVEIGDYLKATITNRNSGESVSTNLPSSNVISFKMENGDVVIARPSGTEPKIKFYYLLSGESKDEMNLKLEAYKAFINQFV